ncbi:MAG: hypothetical protein MK101_02035 [Phycisphaerales bacterium]|nr:hypothetical protein [Phycisphaerales bacterium]
MQSALFSHSAPPGGKTQIAVRLIIPKGWHIYWIDPGEAGTPTTLDITTPPGVTAGVPIWSRPKRITDPAGTLIGYEGQALALVPLQVSADVEPGSILDIAVKADWLICRKACYLGGAEQVERLRIGRDSGASRTVATWMVGMSMPRPLAKRPDTQIHINDAAMTIEGPLGSAGQQVEFIARHVPGMEYGKQSLSVNGGRFKLVVPYHHRRGDSMGRPPAVQGLLTEGRTTADPCWTINQTIAVPSPHKEGDHK